MLQAKKVKARNPGKAGGDPQGSRGGRGSGSDSAGGAHAAPTTAVLTLPLYLKHILNRLWLRGGL